MSVESLIFEKGAPGRRAATMPEMDVPTEALDALLPANLLRQEPAPLTRSKRDRGCAPLYASVAA